jgi:hypothetical protein
MTVKDHPPLAIGERERIPSKGLLQDRRLRELGIVAELVTTYRGVCEHLREPHRQRPASPIGLLMVIPIVVGCPCMLKRRTRHLPQRHDSGVGAGSPQRDVISRSHPV